MWTRCLENQNISGSHQIINNSNQQKCQFTVREDSSLHLKCRHLFQTSGSEAGKKYRDAWNKCTENKLFHSHVCEIKEMHDTQEWMRLTGLYCFYHLDERCPRSAKQDIHTVKTSTTDSNIHLVSYKWDSNANIHTLQQQDVYFFY